MVDWYATAHYGTRDDPGMPTMFMDPGKVGHLAVTLADYAAGKAPALFRILVATAMFQRQRDQQVMRILRSLTLQQATELSDQRTLLRLVDEHPCSASTSTTTLRTQCDLAKDHRGHGVCGAKPGLRCHLKEHTVWLRRYGHFGKVPSSIALAVREGSPGGLPGLYRHVLAELASPRARALELERVLSLAWRVSKKIASMFLATVTNPDLTPRAAPWSSGIDFTHFVVVDSNVDLALASLSYAGPGSYEARRRFLQALAERIDLRHHLPTTSAYNPRLVQQALYLFMSASNRRAASHDCMHQGAPACRRCPATLRLRCSVRSL